MTRFFTGRYDVTWLLKKFPQLVNTGVGVARLLIAMLRVGIIIGRLGEHTLTTTSLFEQFAFIFCFRFGPREISHESATDAQV